MDVKGLKEGITFLIGTYLDSKRILNKNSRKLPRFENQ
jgi:hypothetical protein